jgi:hypothetical protein
VGHRARRYARVTAPAWRLVYESERPSAVAFMAAASSESPAIERSHPSLSSD